MKQIIDLRPVYHRREDRIRAHVLLCWLALLLIRVAETTAGEPWTWNRIRTELQRLHAVTYTGTAGTFRQATAPSKAQRDLLAALKLDPPKDGVLSMEAVAKTYRYLDEEEVAKQRKTTKDKAGGAKKGK